jgi:hypothetical protein
MGAISITAPMTAVFFIGLLALWHYEYNCIYGTLGLLLILSVFRTALDTKTSEFVSTCPGPDGVQRRHNGLYWFGQKYPYVEWILLLFVLSCTRVLVVGVIREWIPGLFGGI